MQINKLILKNFQLFKDQTIILDRINLITGINLDDIASSSNGSGKSTILNAILFGLWSEVTDINLKELIRLETKEATVILEITINNENYRIYRSIPNCLKIYKNEVEIQFNNPTIAQKYLNELFGADFQHFRTYNIIDLKKGINLLDLGTISLRKALMEFCADQFSKIRTSLLSKKLERETFNINKRLYSFYLSTKRQALLETGLLKLQKDLIFTKNDYEEQYKIVGNYKSEISSREKIIYYKNQEMKKIDEGICPILKIKCEKIAPKNKPNTLGITKEIDIIKEEIAEINNLLTSEESCMQMYKDLYESTQKHVQKIKENLMKLKEAQKFSAYKYTKEDVQLFADSVKALDSFSAYYIQEWLQNLAIIINDLLKELNLSIEFSIEKDFIRINNNGQELNYSQLSNGQKTFLGAIFKLGILLQEGINGGLILIDEGINSIDKINLIKLIEILKGLPYQVCLIYQNVPQDLEEINYINVERKNGESKVK